MSSFFVLVSEIFIATASIGTVLVVAGVILVICFLNRRQNQKRGYRRQSLWSELVPEKETRPVISSKTSAGPGGLKNSPSPILSPENPEQELQKQKRNVNDVASDIRKMARTTNINKSVTSMEVQPKSTNQVTLQKQIVDKAVVPGLAAISSTNEVGDENGNSVNQAILHFSLSYNFERNALTVNILRCTNLPNKNVNHPESKKLIDPYIKLQLLPEKQHKIQTRVVRNTLNPVYDEEFIFYGMNYNQIQNTTLHFVIVSFDRYLRDEIIGE
ncbi:unnamed protein product, partial [Soboliphyme baturini]|uniref:C2 domain-containing protein n=1 Tax=Soboliphyme baturini TaxID=241478 RepID=A0A183J786_9BILA